MNSSYPPIWKSPRSIAQRFCSGFLIASSCVAPLGSPAIALAQSFTPPRNSGAPSTTTAGASRGAESCEMLRNKTVITPLAPQAKALDNPQKSQYFSLTLQEHPAFFWHVLPQTAGENADFLLIDHGPMGQQIAYEATVDLPETPGIMQVTLPANVPALQPGHRYQWFLSFNCDVTSLDSQQHLSGWIERQATPSALLTQLTGATLAQRAQLFAEAGIWQDALMALIELRQTTTQNEPAFQGWLQLLDSVGLGGFAAAPLVSVNVIEIPEF